MVYILLGKGFEEIEAVTCCDILRRGGVPVCFAAVGDEKTVCGAHGISIAAEASANSILPEKNNVFVVPGGMGGINAIKSDISAMSLLKKAADAGCCMAAICAGPAVLSALGITDEKTITCYPGCEDMMGSATCKTTHSTYIDGNLITGRAPGSAIDFGLALLARLADSETAENVRRGLVY
ncbi:MAG: DJ-1/PfpI family protein [Clostridia bacterium]|nr:DJ-1/PfpI family protein [Clostridia bacterium]